MLAILRSLGMVVTMVAREGGNKLAEDADARENRGMKRTRLTLLSASLMLLALACCATAQAEEITQWVKTRAITAPEANQAAAADDRYLYAIDNARVARYDRKTGARVDASTGDAQHLNSGFLYEGKLYCAHSNYPRTPEQSEIKALNPATMELTTYHDFGNFGGSLTWCVHEADHWWCNFARYGKVNAETFLVKFDDQWREQARYTYPKEVIARLGAYSISGGVWREKELLVTDHDHRRLYRLRLPKEGTLLELLGEIPSPFPGQGIASDPVTKGLIGVDRAKREMVLALPE